MEEETYSLSLMRNEWRNNDSTQRLNTSRESSSAFSLVFHSNTSINCVKLQPLKPLLLPFTKSKTDSIEKVIVYHYCYLMGRELE